MYGEPVLERYRTCWIESIGLMRRRYLFMPFLGIFAAKIIPLVLVFWFWHPLFSSFMTPIIKSLGGEALLHYPEHIRLLPNVFRFMEIVVMIVVGFAMLGWAVFLLVDAIQGRRYRAVKYGGEVALFVPPILVIGLSFVLCVLGVPFLFEWLADQFDRPKLQMLLLATGQLGGFAAEVLLIYSLFFLRQVRGKALTAMKTSINFARANLAITVLLVGTAVLIQKPFELLAGDAGSLVARMQGDLVLVYLLLGTAVEVFAHFFLMASTTWIAITAMSEK